MDRKEKKTGNNWSSPQGQEPCSQSRCKQASIKTGGKACKFQYIVTGYQIAARSCLFATLLVHQVSSN